MIVARLDEQGAVLDFMDWRDETVLPETCRAATADEIAALTPPAPAPEPPTPREWLERLSADKQAAIAAAARGSDALFLWFMKASGSATIDVTLPETIAGVAALVTAGVLSADDQGVLLGP